MVYLVCLKTEKVKLVLKNLTFQIPQKRIRNQLDLLKKSSQKLLFTSCAMRLDSFGTAYSAFSRCDSYVTVLPLGINRSAKRQLSHHDFYGIFLYH